MVKLKPKRGDVVYTPEWCAKDMVAFFKPSGTVLEPCKGAGVFMPLLPPTAEWCEIQEGRDFFARSSPVDWIIGNPPYSKTREWLRHSYKIGRDIVYLVPLRNIFSGYGCLRESYEFGGIKNIRLYGTGSRLGFPMGNAVGAVHWSKDYIGPINVTLYDRDSAESAERLLEHVGHAVECVQYGENEMAVECAGCGEVVCSVEKGTS